jgi:Helix-turn-helix domain/DnaJ domain
MDKKNKKIGYYEILDLSENATRKEIVEAYQKAKGIYGKDSMAVYSLYSNEDSTDMLNLIDEAYQVLINPQRRELYNKEHNINSHRSVVNIFFDKPGEIKRAFVETPNFKRMPENDLSEAAPEINKEAFKAYVSISKQDMTPTLPDYKTSEEMETKIKAEINFNGEFFAEVRAYRNMSLGYVSNKTKVPIYHIEAVERENYAVLPARVYTLGFLKTYAKLLGFDQEKAPKAYIERYDKATK